MKKKVDCHDVHIPSKSEIRVTRYMDRIVELGRLILKLDSSSYPWAIKILNRESMRLVRLLIKEVYGD